MIRTTINYLFLRVAVGAQFMCLRKRAVSVV